MTKSQAPPFLVVFKENQKDNHGGFKKEARLKTTMLAMSEEKNRRTTTILGSPLKKTSHPFDVLFQAATREGRSTWVANLCEVGKKPIPSPFSCHYGRSRGSVCVCVFFSEGTRCMCVFWGKDNQGKTKMRFWGPLTRGAK